MLDGTSIEDGTYNIMKDGNLCLQINSDKSCEEGLLEVDVNGETPKEGYVEIKNGRINYAKFKSSNYDFILKNGKVNFDELGDALFEGTMDFALPEEDSEISMASIEDINDIASKLKIQTHYDLIIDGKSIVLAAFQMEDGITLFDENFTFAVGVESGQFMVISLDYENLLMGKHDVKLMESDREFVRYIYRNEGGFSWLYSYDFSPGTAKIVITAEGESTPLYSNENATFTDEEGYVGFYGAYGVDNSGLTYKFNDAAYDALKAGKIITITVTQTVDGEEKITTIGGYEANCSAYDENGICEEFYFGNNFFRFGT